VRVEWVSKRKIIKEFMKMLQGCIFLINKLMRNSLFKICIVNIFEEDLSDGFHRNSYQKNLRNNAVDFPDCHKKYKPWIQ